MAAYGVALAGGFTHSGRLPVPMERPPQLAMITPAVPANQQRPRQAADDDSQVLPEPDPSTLLSRITLTPLSDEERALDSKELKPDSVDYVKIIKHQHLILLMSRDQVVRRYHIRLGRHPEGAKEVQGDGKTPEGLYLIDKHKADSEFHLSLHISYPNADDVAHAHALHKQPGGQIFIHGLPYDTPWVVAYHQRIDWTNGCIALTNHEIEDIYRLIPDGTPVRITP